MRSHLSVAVLALALCTVSTSSWATCQKLGFSVNDYGIEGPKRDAKRLLDDYIKRWAKKQGIKRYRTGKKTVTCELFIDVGFFDEHTCKAVANVCWSGKPRLEDLQ